jgi:TetR/AcrR family transcriptional regulator of autoinduction and epiphytic fitness
MKTQTEPRRNAKRETILDAATASFRDDGYESASMDRIAELAGASKRTVYNHFGSKEALFQAVLGRVFDEAVALKQVAWDPDRPLEHQLADFARAKALVSQDESSLNLYRVVLGVFIKHPELTQEVMARAANDESSLVSWLEAADKAGRLSVPKPELAAKIFWAMASGALFWPQLLEGPMNPEARDVLVDELVSTFLARYRSVFG